MKPYPKTPKRIKLSRAKLKALQEEVLLRDSMQCQTCGEATQAPPHHIVAVARGDQMWPETWLLSAIRVIMTFTMDQYNIFWKKCLNYMG